MAREFIVAIELGSSKMTGIAGKKKLDGSIDVLAVVREDSSTFIRKGVVYNIDKTAQCITNIVKKLTTTLKTNIMPKIIANIVFFLLLGFVVWIILSSGLNNILLYFLVK